MMKYHWTLEMKVRIGIFVLSWICSCAMMSSTNLGIWDLFRLCCASSVFFPSCFCTELWVQIPVQLESLIPARCSTCLGFGFGWFLAPAGVLNCWVKLPAWIFPFHGEISLWWGPSACRSSSCVPSWPDPLPGLGNWKQHTQNTCLGFPYTNHTRKLCLDAFSWLERDVRDKKNPMEPQFPKIDNYPNFVLLLRRELGESSWNCFIFPSPWILLSEAQIFVTSVSSSQGHPMGIPTKGQLLEFICA